MTFVTRLRSFLSALVGRRRLEREMEQEWQFHRDARIDSLTAGGVSRADAEQQARREFGDPLRWKEQGREAYGLRWIQDLGADVRYALRQMRRTPGFTAVALLTLALGIGANSAIFSLSDAVLLRPLPVRDSNTVVTVSAAGPDHGMGGGGVSYPNYRDLREESRSFDGLIAYQQSTFSFARSRQATPEMRVGMLVSENFFSVLGIQTVLGRSFTPEEGEAPGRDAVVVLGYDFWRNVVAGGTSIINGVVQINGTDFTVVGVAPERFTGMDQSIRPAFYMPIMMAGRLSAARENLLTDRGARSFVVKGRLASRVSQKGAQAELTTLWKGLEQQYPDANRNRTMAVRSELEERIRKSPLDAIVMALLMALVAIVLSIACANVANLMLGRARTRSHEMAIRLALGVSRMRLLRQLLTESLLLALIGGALGLGLASGVIRLLQASQVTTDLSVGISPQLDHRVLTFSLLAAVVSAVLFGLAPAWQSVKTQLVPALKNGAPGEMTRHRTVGRNVLVVGQVALSMVLLVATGLLLDGFRKALVLNPGFRTDHLIVMSLDTSFVRYTPVRTHEFYGTLADRARALPGVASVALTSWVPLDRGGSIKTVIPEGHQFPQGQENVSLFAAFVDEHYFSTMKTEIVRGRAFTADDDDGSRRVAIVNEEFAKTYWSSQDPIGKRVRLNDSQGPWLEVVGLAKTGKYLFIGEAPMPFVYLPFAQNERTQMAVLVEATNSDAASLAAPLRDVVHALDANQPVYNVQTLSSFYERRAIAAPLMIMQMVGAMSVLGLTLALVGLYGLVGYSVARRTREIGIRMAIGADRSDVLQMVLRQGLMLSMAGILVGGVASVAVARLLTSALVGLGTPNPATYIIVPTALICLTMVASYFPARRATKVDPLVALRCE